MPPIMKGVSEERIGKPIDRAIGKVMQSAYTLKGLSQAKLVERTGITTTTMQRLISGKAAWSADQIIAVGDAIGGPKSAEELFAEAIAFVPHLDD